MLQGSGVFSKCSYPSHYQCPMFTLTPHLTEAAFRGQVLEKRLQIQVFCVCISTWAWETKTSLVLGFHSGLASGIAVMSLAGQQRPCFTWMGVRHWDRAREPDAVCVNLSSAQDQQTPGKLSLSGHLSFLIWKWGWKLYRPHRFFKWWRNTCKVPRLEQAYNKNANTQLLWNVQGWWQPALVQSNLYLFCSLNLPALHL